MTAQRLAGSGMPPLMAKTVAGQIEDRIGAVVTSVKQFGAKGDDSADDTAAIQAAIDEAAELPYGGSVYVPPGRYLCNIKMQSRVELFGSVSGSILKSRPNVNEPAVSLDNDEVKFTTLRNLVIDGNSDNNTGGDCYGIWYVNQGELTGTGLYPDIGDPQHRILNVVVTKTASSGIKLLTRETQLQNFLITHTGRSGLQLEGSDNWVNAGSINWTNRLGVIIEGGNNQLVQVKCWYIGLEDAWETGDAYRLDSSGNSLIGCTAQDTSRHGLRINAYNNEIAGMRLDSIGMQHPINDRGWPHESGVAAISFGVSNIARNKISAVLSTRHGSPTCDYAIEMQDGNVDNQIDLTIAESAVIRTSLLNLHASVGRNSITINNRHYQSAIDAEDVDTTTDLDTTPSVLNRVQIRVANSQATTITNLDDGVDGQAVDLLMADGNTTIADNATIKGTGSAYAADAWYRFRRYDGVWYPA